jgi:nitroreductase
MNQIIDVIKKRRSIRAYKDKSLSKETIESILEAARYAPTASNLQQLEYKVITNKKLIKKISERIVEQIKKESSFTSLRDKGDLIFYDAPLVIIIIGPEDNKWIYSDAALAVQNIMLYATSIGLGTCFIGRVRYIEKVKDSGNT